jgi:hypothetical protein
MASRREQVMEALVALLAGALPGALVRRNLAKPERLPAGGLVIVRDGDPGEPEVLLSPLTYIYTHRVPLEIAAREGTTQSREQVLDAMLAAVGAAVRADRTLGGLCEFLEAEAPATADIEEAGAAPGRWADAVIAATYATADPLN